MTAFIPQGVAELENLKQYALSSLNNEEKLFIKKAEKELKALTKNQNNKFLTSNIGNELCHLWHKYDYLKPFIFDFDPGKTMPEVFKNRTALIIWATWRSCHLLGEQDLKKASLATANILAKFQPPYSREEKMEALKKFALLMGEEDQRIPRFIYTLWERRLFMYLNGEWEFKWEIQLPIEK